MDTDTNENRGVLSSIVDSITGTDRDGDSREDTMQRHAEAGTTESVGGSNADEFGELGAPAGDGIPLDRWEPPEERSADERIADQSEQEDGGGGIISKSGFSL